MRDDRGRGRLEPFGDPGELFAYSSTNYTTLQEGPVTPSQQSRPTRAVGEECRPLGAEVSADRGTHRRPHVIAEGVAK